MYCVSLLKMKRALTQFLLLSILAVLPLKSVIAQQPQNVNSDETLIRNATVLTITHGVLQNSDVLIRKGKIVAIGKNLKAGANARVIDATGKFVMPGII